MVQLRVCLNCGNKTTCHCVRIHKCKLFVILSIQSWTEPSEIKHETYSLASIHNFTIYVCNFSPLKCLYSWVRDFVWVCTFSCRVYFYTSQLLCGEWRMAVSCPVLLVRNVNETTELYDRLILIYLASSVEVH